MKLNRLFQLGLASFTSFSLAGVLSSCSSGGDDGLTGGGNGNLAGGTGLPLGSAGAQSNPVGNGGSGNVSSSGSGNIPGSAGASSNGGVTSSQGGATAGSSNGNGGAAQQPCTNAPPNNGDTCQHAVEYGWCKEPWLGESCRESCGKCSTAGSGTGSGNGGAGNGGGSNNGSSGAYTGGFGGGGGQPPAIEGGTPGWASRYWDCCKPACGWKGNVPGGSTPVHSCNQQNQSLGGNYDAKNACEGDAGGAYMCGNFGPWAVSDKLAYGYAAVKMGNDYCGKCYQIEFTGSSHSNNNDPGSQSLKGKTMIVQAINTGGVDGTQFDLLIPGGGVGDFDACSAQWGSGVDLGERYGGFYLECQKQNGFDYNKSKACAAQRCQAAFAGKPDFLAGCNFFVNWLGAPDNPNLIFKETSCPSALTQLSGLKR